MEGDPREHVIETRRDLFDFLDSQMQSAYRSLRGLKRLESETTLIKSYIFEVDVPKRMDAGYSVLKEKAEFVEHIFSLTDGQPSHTVVTEKGEEGFFEVRLPGHPTKHQRSDAILYLDTATDERFWLAYSVSNANTLNWWLASVLQARTEFDFVWLWPKFLETIQQRGEPRGFGLHYDFRKFEEGSDEKTTYLKMQLWGGRETDDLYRTLRTDDRFRDKTVLSKVRLKEWGENPREDAFALQDIKYTGKFTSRGTDFSTHLGTLSHVRSEYKKAILSIEESYALKWREGEAGGVVLEGYAINFFPSGFSLPVDTLSKVLLNGRGPFRLMGFVTRVSDSFVVAEVVDLHSGGEFSMEICPDFLTIYLPEYSCGNTVARLYTNLQHYFSMQFTVEADNGDQLF